MNTPKQILVPTDFSAPAKVAKDYAAMLAEGFGATVHFLYVIPDPLAMGWGVDAAYLPQLLDRTEREVKEQLKEHVKLDEGKFETRVAIETGSAAPKIVEYAKAHAIDLIVMGTQGRGAVERWWVGSVTQGVLHRAPCPVVAVQQPRS